jgi:hypothetical protein
MQAGRVSAAVLASVVLLGTQGAAPGGNAAPKGGRRQAKNVSPEERLDALARAQVWRRPTVPISRADLAGNPSLAGNVDCTFTISDLGGTAPKFDCVLGDGEKIRVKYGDTPEIPSEVAATRLLRALGFAADDVSLVERVRCHGCPRSPFITMRVVDLTRTAPLYERLVDYDSHRDFEWAAVERRHPGRAIESPPLSGWAFFELSQIDPARGGAPRAHVDALRLMAVFLAHWDNKSDNQRLVCLSDDDWKPGASCRKPFAMLHDVGSSFGPSKIDLAAWERTPIWTDRGACTTSLRGAPYQGGTFAPVAIGDAGRRFLASLLRQLSDRQLTDLFTGARFHAVPASGGAEPAPVAAWVRVFRKKVAEIEEGPACPQ